MASALFLQGKKARVWVRLLFGRATRLFFLHPLGELFHRKVITDVDGLKPKACRPVCRNQDRRDLDEGAAEECERRSSRKAVSKRASGTPDCSARSEPVAALITSRTLRLVVLQDGCVLKVVAELSHSSEHQRNCIFKSLDCDLRTLSMRD